MGSGFDLKTTFKEWLLAPSSRRASSLHNVYVKVGGGKQVEMSKKDLNMMCDKYGVEFHHIGSIVIKKHKELGINRKLTV
jgi:hypothetical protein